MAANNPHLPKKRSGLRQGLGRSFMRYLAEFPEALARQHSRDSSSQGRSSLPGSSRRRLLSFSLQEPEGPPALRKSRSTYDRDHHREQEPPLHDSLLKRKLAKKAPRGESRESLEGPPALGFRSASAHNLTVGERLPRARSTSLQKSLSVMAGSREKALLVASQAYLEETYRQAKEREERKKAEAALASPVRRLSSRRLERGRGAPLSAPPSPAKSSSVDSSGKLQAEAVRKLPHPPIQHQISTPIMTLSAACLGEPRMLSPTSTLTPALIPAPPLAPAPTLAPIPIHPQNPSLLTFICPWENAELPVKKENVVQEGPSGPEQGNHSPAPARARLWRALSVAVEKKGAGENEMNAEDKCLQGEADNVDEDKPKAFSKSHSLKTPVQQSSVRSLGLAIKALTRSRSTHREKESGEESSEKEKGRVSGEGVGACPRSPRVGGRKVMSKQAALAPCEDEESLQNQQNAHTSRMLQVGNREQEDRGKRTSQGQGNGKIERASKTGPITLRQVRQGTVGDKNADRAKEAPVRRQELLKAGLQPLGSVDCKVAEVCPWEVAESETCQPDSSNKAEICPWEVSEGATERGALGQDIDGSQEERGKAPEESEPKDVVAITQKKSERLLRGQEAVCPWENADSGSLSPQSAHQDSDRTKSKSEAGSSVEAREVKCQREVTGPEACTPAMAKAELCPWEASEGENEKLSQERVKKLPQEKQKIPKKATFWKEQKLGGDLESLCSWESTDFRGPLAISTEAPGSPECSGSLSGSLTEVCPWEAGEAPAIQKAEICPWELGDEVVGKEILWQETGGEPLQEEGQASRKAMGGQTEKAGQTPSLRQESVCPWESTASGHPSPRVDDSSSRHSGQLLSDGGSRATQVCPREDIRPEVKAEICPWEINERTTEDQTSEQAHQGGDSQKDEEKMPETSGIKDVTSWEKPEGQIQKQEAICPWESVDPGSFPLQPGPQDTDRPKASFQVSGSVGSITAAICPWDMEDTLPAAKAEICPWEVSPGTGEERDLGVEAIRKLPVVTGKASADSGPGEIAVTAPKNLERPAREWEVACPWEGMDPGASSQPPDTVDTDRPKAGLQEIDHVGCRPAEVCPWEMEKSSTSEKAKICPWKVNEGPTGKGTEQEMGDDSAGQREKTLEKGRLTNLEKDISKGETKLSQEQEAICPWEDLREPNAQAPEVSDLSSSVRSKAAERHSSEVSDEAAEKGDLTRDPQTGSVQEHITQEKAPSSKAEVTTEDGGKASNQLQSICPWENTAPASSSSNPDGQCPDQLKASSQKPASVGDRHAEVCPWDIPAPDAHPTDSTAKAEICPWEVTTRIPEKGVSRQDEKGERQEEERKAPEKPEPKVMAVQEEPERAERKQEAVCPWESQDSGGLSPQTAPQASDRSKGSPEAAGSTGARVAEVCPWEAEVPSAKKAEICPWEVSQAVAEEGGPEQVERELQGQGELFLQNAGSGWTEEHFSKAAAKGSREQEMVCPWEGTGSGRLFSQPEAADTDQPRVSPHGASSVGNRMAELCQWEITDPEGNKIKGTMADICPWEGTGDPSEESGLLALTATRTEVFFSTAPENPPCLSVQRPLGGSLPESKSPRPKVSKPASTSTLEGVRELQGLSGLGPRTSLAPGPSLQEAEAQKSSSLTEDQGEVTSKVPHEELASPTVYPWDWE